MGINKAILKENLQHSWSFLFYYDKVCDIGTILKLHNYTDFPVVYGGDVLSR